MEFLTYDMRNVVGDEQGGIYHAIIGTLLVTAAAAIISIPVGLFCAIYLVEYGKGKRLARWITFLVDVMTGIPSIVAGLFALAVFVLIFGPQIRLGFGGSVALSLLMIPIVVRSTEEMLRLVPDDLREASYALGEPEVAHDHRRSCCPPRSAASSPASCWRSPGSSARPRRCWSSPARPTR